MEAKRRSAKNVCKSGDWWRKSKKAPNRVWEAVSTRPRRCRFKGAIDILIVEHPDGTLKSSPWQLRSKGMNLNTVVNIAINNVELAFTMQLCKLARRDERTGVGTNVPNDHELRQICSNLRSDENGGDGENKIRFFIRGPPDLSVSAHIYYWKWKENYKVVVTDVDGTITRSDFGGLFGSWIREPWIHEGITSAFSYVQKNGYKTIYLTARPISIIDSTRKSIFIEDRSPPSPSSPSEPRLPRGPVITTTFGFWHTIKLYAQRIPHSAFKGPCLKAIERLFLENENPFYAAFGNRMTDVKSYQVVGIPIDRIYYILKSGAVETRDDDGDKLTWFRSFDLLARTLSMFEPIEKSFQPSEKTFQNLSDSYSYSDLESRPLLD